MVRSCIALFSGGLDSTLALRLMVVQGIEVVAFYARNCFHGTEDWPAKEASLERRAKALGAKDFVVRDLTDDVVALVKSNRYGFGKNLNPCIDCRIRTVMEGKRLMDERGADFVVNGEVLGQRPMSQRPDALRTTDRHVAEAGFAGRLVRPLCAKLLSPTLPEREGWIDREKLYDFSGRNRKPQLALAVELGITDFPSPAGGCLLTDPGYSARLADLAAAKPDWGPADAELLKVGRHYRLGPATKAVIGRNEQENRRLAELLPAGTPVYLAADVPGAYVAVVGEWTPEAESWAGGAAVYFSKARGAASAAVAAWRQGEPGTRRTAGTFASALEADLEAKRVARDARLAMIEVRKMRSGNKS